MASKFQTFAALHVPGDPVVLYNIWDVGSALAVVRAGAKALATGSHPVADANGWPDGNRSSGSRRSGWRSAKPFSSTPAPTSI
jgi:2-methylisocitrate lyase-like PEP mutase family enzyme